MPRGRKPSTPNIDSKVETPKKKRGRPRKIITETPEVPKVTEISNTTPQQIITPEATPEQPMRVDRKFYKSPKSLDPKHQELVDIYNKDFLIRLDAATKDATPANILRKILDTFGKSTIDW